VSESLCVGFGAFIDVSGAVLEHPVDQDRQLTSGGKDGHGGVFASCQAAIGGSQSRVGVFEGKRSHAQGGGHSVGAGALVLALSDRLSPGDGQTGVRRNQEAKWSSVGKLCRSVPTSLKISWAVEGAMPSMRVRSTPVRRHKAVRSACSPRRVSAFSLAELGWGAAWAWARSVGCRAAKQRLISAS